MKQGKIRKLLISACGACVLIACILIISILTWSKTPYGNVDPGVAVFLKILSWSGGNPLEKGRPLKEVRNSSRKTALFKSTPPRILKIQEKTIPGSGGGIPIRIYYPKQGNSGPLPVVMYYHGGGWSIGDLDSHDDICRIIAHMCGVLVISTDYRRAPEHRYPAAIEDAFAALLWARDNAGTLGADSYRIAVAGDSAGGNIAAVVSLKARERDRSLIRSQVLIYPVVDISSMKTESYKNFASGYFLTEKSMKIFRSMYAPDSRKWKDPFISPLRSNNLCNLPPAFIVTAEFDVLRDEGEVYAARLRAGGTKATSKRYRGVIHGFISLNRLSDKSEEAFNDIVRFLKETLFN